MKQLLVIFLFFSFLNCFAQPDQFKVGATWYYENAFIRDSSYWESPYARGMDSIYPVEIHDFKFYEGLAKVVYNEQVGFIDTNKIVVIPLVYQTARGANKFLNSKAVVIQHNKWGVIDSAGTVVIPFVYDDIKRFNDLYYVAENYYKWGYLDADGNAILPMREYRRSYIMTEEEILELAGQYRQKDSLENATPVSKERAINIAKRNGYYIDDSDAFAPSVELSSDLKEWIVKSTERKGTTKKGDCGQTNGCIVQVKYLIVIDSNTGNVKDKSKTRVLMPIYE